MSNKMDELKLSLESIVDFIHDKNDVFYVDFPLHHNVGDLLIMEGALQLMSSKGVNIREFQCAENFDVLRLKKKITSNTTILCHGGGNFGDLYEKHQYIRSEVIKNFPDNTVIIMPQTAFHSSEQAESKSVNVFSSHKNLVMFSRDIKTHELFSKMTDKSFLMPDTAHYLYGSLPITSKINDKLFFLRKDIEVNPFQEKLMAEAAGHSIDWEDILSAFDIFYLKVLRKFAFVSRRLKVGSFLVYMFWRQHSKSLTKRSAKMFSSYNTVITSRMHGHILSCLVDTDNKVIDNSYGKNHGYFNQWTYDVDCAEILNKLNSN